MRIAPASAAVTITVTAVVAVTVTLGGCSRDAVSAAPHADNPACATALGKLPGALLGQTRGTSSVAGTAVFGDPTVVVRCGVTPPGPTTLRCLSVNDVDWVVDDRLDPLVFTTFGRSPAVEVRIPESYPVTGDSAALVDLQAVAEALPKTSRQCIG